MVRKIFVSDLSQIDFDNFGVHFSLDNNYKHSGGGSNGLTPECRYRVSAWVRRAKINEVATAVSNENHPHEKEVVLQFGQNLTAEIGIWDMLENKSVRFEKRKICTGTRADKWVTSLA